MTARGSSREVDLDTAPTIEVMTTPGDHNDVADRLAAIDATAGSADDIFEPDYLDRLRADWGTARQETESILSDPELMKAIRAGLADGEAGHVFSHEDVVNAHSEGADPETPDLDT